MSQSQFIILSCRDVFIIKKVLEVNKKLEKTAKEKNKQKKNLALYKIND